MKGLERSIKGYTGPKPAAAAQAHGIALEVVKLPDAKPGFVLLPRRWAEQPKVPRAAARGMAAEGSNAPSPGWATRCRRLVKYYERYATTLAGFYVVAFACFMLRQAALLAASS
jgi:hypothetical protein